MKIRMLETKDGFHKGRTYDTAKSIPALTAHAFRKEGIAVRVDEAETPEPEKAQNKQSTEATDE